MGNPLHSLVATYRARIDEASTADELGALYVEIVGYDPFEDDPSIAPDEVRTLLSGVVDEMAHNFGV